MNYNSVNLYKSPILDGIGPLKLLLSKYLFFFFFFLKKKKEINAIKLNKNINKKII